MQWTRKRKKRKSVREKSFTVTSRWLSLQAWSVRERTSSGVRFSLFIVKSQRQGFDVSRGKTWIYLQKPLNPSNILSLFLENARFIWDCRMTFYSEAKPLPRWKMTMLRRQTFPKLNNLTYYFLFLWRCFIVEKSFTFLFISRF